MKRSALFPGLWLLAVTLTWSGCARPSGPAVGTKPERLEAVDEATQQKITAARDQLFERLSGRLMEVLQEQGPAAAIGVCSQEAPLIAQQVSQEQGLEIARTSLKLRNPDNAPPAWAERVIRESPPAEPQYFDIGDGHTGALLPIKLQATCVLCHGPQETLLEEVQAELAKFYPQDRATGYQEGDLRGWFWIDLPPGQAAQPKEQL